MNKYTLVKLSSPGFDLNTDNIHHVFNMLQACICDNCQQYSEDDTDFCLPVNYKSLSVEDKVYALLSTSCGAEYALEEDGNPPTYEAIDYER